MPTISRKLLRRESGYEVWEELTRPEYDMEVIDGGDDPDATQEIADTMEDASGRLVTSQLAYTPDGKYIGNLETAQLLCGVNGIKPEALPGHNVCSIGFCEAEQKWFGWSHRAIYGFAVGDVAKEGDCVCSSGWTDEYLAEHPEEDMSLPVGFVARELADAKRMAVAFAESVG